MVHHEADTTPARGETRTCRVSTHPLPVEIINVILRLAAATSPSTEVLQWLSLCRAAHSWIAPILYANVFIRSTYHLHLFHDALERHPIRGRWVKALWVASGKQAPGPSLTCPSRPSQPSPPSEAHSQPRSLSISTVSTRHSPWARPASFPLLSNDTARDPTFDLVHILQHCPNLRHLALVGCSLLASALQVAAYPFRLRTLLLGPPICLKFRCMAHLSLLQVLRVVGIPPEKMGSWRDWCGEVRALPRLRTLELVGGGGANERRVVSIDKPAANQEPTPSPAVSSAHVNGEKHREIESPSGVSPNAAPGMASGTYRDNEIYQHWTTDRAEETAASCLDF